MTGASFERPNEELFQGWAELWPMACDVGFFHAKYSRVVRQLGKARLGEYEARYPELRTAVETISQTKDLGVVRAWYLVASTTDEWTMVLDSRCPHTDLGEYMVSRAALDVKSDYIFTYWLPKSPPNVPELDSAPAGAGFLDYRISRWPHKRQQSIKRFVQVSEQSPRRWIFDASGPVRDYEDLSRYALPRKPDRLNLSMLATYLSRSGVPTTDSWLANPTTVIYSNTGGSRPLAYVSVSDLRRRLGYPLDHVPTSLTKWSV